MKKRDRERQLSVVARMPKEYVWCRSIRHAWTPDGVRAMRPDEVPAKLSNKHVIARWLRCERCDAVRQELFVRQRGSLQQFTKVKTRYIMPGGYLWSDYKEPVGAPDQWTYTDVLLSEMEGG